MLQNSYNLTQKIAQNSQIVFSCQINLHLPYNFIMPTLSNLTLILDHPNTIFIANKQLTLTAATTVTATKSIPRSSGHNQIVWDDAITLPYVNAITFQIATKHQFGYNPEELASVIQGTINLQGVKGQQKMITSKVFNLQGEKVGYLKANIKVGSSPKKHSPLSSSQIIIHSQPKILPSPPNKIEQSPPQSLMVTSVIAHADIVKGKKIQLKFKWSNATVVSEQFSSKSGEIVFIGNYELKDSNSKANKDTQLIVQLYDNSKQSLLGNALFFIDSLGKLTKKGVLKDAHGQQIGDMFIEGKLIEVRPNRYGNRSALEIRQSTSPKGNLGSSLVKSSANMKRSIVNSNNTIRFSKEVRFFENLMDKKNPYVSYQNPGTLDFKQQRTKKFYRGASIGRGDKYDFTAIGANKPGVGQYFLPSIWDRY